MELYRAISIKISRNMMNLSTRLCFRPAAERARKQKLTRSGKTTHNTFALYWLVKHDHLESMHKSDKVCVSSS